MLAGAAACGPVEAAGGAAAEARVSRVPVATYADAPPVGALIDVRTPEEFAGGHLPGAQNVPLDAIESGTAVLPAGPLVVVCASGKRSARAAATLARDGRSVTDLAGGTGAWVAAGLPLER
jgi:rhodanese-related sulfurtransferase